MAWNWGNVWLSENLTPAELRKLKNKQRKKAKKEALQKEKAKHDEHSKKEQQKQKTADTDLDGPKEEELLPEKLAKVWRAMIRNVTYVWENKINFPWRDVLQ